MPQILQQVQDDINTNSLLLKKLKELLSDTLVYGISSVLARFVGYLLVPLHTDVFVESQYGIINLVYVTLAFLNVVFTFGMESAYLRYAKDRDKAKDVFKTIQLGLGVLSSVLVGLLILCAPLLMPAMKLEATGSESLYWMMLGILWFDTMVLVPFAELRLVRKQWLFAFLRTANIVLNVGLQFYLILWQGWGIEAVFFASFIASAATALVIWIATAQMFTGAWDTAVMRKAMRFGLPFIPAGLGFVINEMLDRYFLEHYMSQATVNQLYGADLTSLDIVGIYSACYKLSVFMLLLVQMFRMAWQPFFLRNADDPEAPRIYSNVFRYFNVVAGICFLGVALLAYQIVQIKVPFMDAYIIGKDYWAGLNIVPVLLGAYWFQGWYMNFSAGIFIKEETKTLPKITLFGAGITILFNLLLIPYYGMMGSAVATLISYVSMAFALYWKSRNVYEVPYQIGRSMLMVLVAAACVFAQPYFESWMGSFWIGSIMLFLIGTIVFVGLGLQGRQATA